MCFNNLYAASWRGNSCVILRRYVFCNSSTLDDIRHLFWTSLPFSDPTLHNNVHSRVITPFPCTAASCFIAVSYTPLWKGATPRPPSRKICYLPIHRFPVLFNAGFPVDFDSYLCCLAATDNIVKSSDSVYSSQESSIFSWTTFYDPIVFPPYVSLSVWKISLPDTQN